MKMVFVKSCATLLLIVSADSARAEFFFGRPQNLGPAVNSPFDEVSSSIAADGLSLYFASNRPGGSGEYDLWVSTRPSTSEPWGPAVNLGANVNSPYSEMDPSISADGLSLYFSDPHNQMGFGRRRPGGFASGDGGNVWVVTRTTANDPWSSPVNLGPDFNSKTYDQVVHPSISADGLSLYVHACARGIGVATRASTAEPFGTPELLRFPGNGNLTWWPGISADERALFTSVWNWGSMDFDLWVTTRSAADGEFGPMIVLPPEINYRQSWALCPSISADGSTLYFCSWQPGGLGAGDLWRASILPAVDFSRDDKVDIQDLLRLIESWGLADPSVDIGPMPWGDGVVDAADLHVLMSFWGQEAYSPSLVACWKLDEEDGVIAADSAGANDATVIGDALWQPEGGKLGGALLFDGADDFAATEFICDPSQGPFSAFAWVKGGAPGQVILSQTGGASWLSTDASGGRLMTHVVRPANGRLTPQPLTSQVVITDGSWHRVGLVWDSSCRILYVDGIEVARDVQSSLAPSTGGLYIGAGSELAIGSFWTGLIDDVRIYNRVVKP